MNCSIIKGKTSIYLCAIGWLLYFLGYCKDPESCHIFCLIGFSILTSGLLFEIILIKMIKAKDEPLLPLNQNIFDFNINNTDQIIDTKLAIDILFLNGCIIYILWQIILRAYETSDADLLYYIELAYINQFIILYIMFLVASCIAIANVNLFPTECKVLAKLSYISMLLGSITNIVIYVILLLNKCEIFELSIDLYEVRLIGNSCILLGFVSRIGFNEIIY
jgi:hypothetical protein